MQREYEEFKIRINALVAKAQKTPEEGWTMQDGTPWPGNNPRDHPGMIQVSPSLVRIFKATPLFFFLFENYHFIVFPFLILFSVFTPGIHRCS